ncbi:hypothetical protein PACTADRAFT_49737 [Pachysolen tannophilus NRRL Y-2460]|uniref:Kinesin-like protein KIP1 n=1 Tax=Pachysolen tannophilus NRRL Y-2460 TaxID=669874 RepID=A0A1E4TXI6_PACTA|nr:hypothetical protein PACTADRAFT_49737 [Pachysolen tannophilus NRRL Y-2460]
MSSSGNTFRNRLGSPSNNTGSATGSSVNKRSSETPTPPLKKPKLQNHGSGSSGSGGRQKSDTTLAESNISVYVRCRSRNEREINENSGVVISTLGHNGKEVIIQQNGSTNKTYTFDRVFGAESDQEILFDGVASNVLQEMLKGYNCTIFAYGQTGTGKTYTMSGDLTSTTSSTSSMGLSVDAGIIPRTLVELFKNLKESNHPEFSVRISFIELYNEELRDLLLPENCERKVRIYDDHTKKSIVVQGMEEVFIQNAQEGLKVLNDGSYKRQVASTQCNDLSSRSHTVFTITVHMKKIDPLTGEEFLKIGKLNLVDLAGSENISRSGAENKRAREAGMINQSLLTLGRVINSLVDKTPHIPYRESKLTRLLQDSLGGKTKTCIIATISPAKISLEETLSTLEYANRAKSIKNKPQVNHSMSKQLLISEYIQEIESLRKDLNATRSQTGGVYMTQESYNNLTSESESRRILTEDQKLRIDLLEDQNKRYKTQYEQQQEISRQNDLKIAELELKLNKTTKELQESKLKVIDFETKYKDELILKKEHVKTETILHELNKSLLKLLDNVILNKNELHEIIDEVLKIENNNVQSLEDKKIKTTSLLKIKIDNFLLKLDAENNDLTNLLNKNLNTAIEEHKLKVCNKISNVKNIDLFFQDKISDILKKLSLSISNFNSSADGIEDVKKELQAEITNQLIGLKKFVEENISNNMESIGEIQNLVQDSFHEVGKLFKSAIDVVHNQLVNQYEEIEILKNNSNSHYLKYNKLLKDQLIANEIIHKKEIENQEQEQQQLIKKIVELVKNSTSNRIERATTVYDSSSKTLNTIHNENHQFNEYTDEKLYKWLHTQQFFTEALINEKLRIKNELISKHEKTATLFTDLNTNLDSNKDSIIDSINDSVDKIDPKISILNDYSKKLKNEIDSDLSDTNGVLSSLQKESITKFAKLSQDFNEIGNHLINEIKPNIIDVYTSNEKQMINDFKANTSAIVNEANQLIQSIEIAQMDKQKIPARKPYSYTREIPLTRPDEEILAIYKHGKLPRIDSLKNGEIKPEDNSDMSMSNDTFGENMNSTTFLENLENFSPLPIPIPDRPIKSASQATNSSKLRNLQQLQDIKNNNTLETGETIVRRSKDAEGPQKRKVFQQLNIN